MMAADFSLSDYHAKVEESRERYLKREAEKTERIYRRIMRYYKIDIIEVENGDLQRRTQAEIERNK